MSLQAAAPRLVLASASPARRGLLAGAGLTFDVQPAAVDENDVKRAVRAEGGTAAEAAVLLAELKAGRIARGNPDAIVIGADQILVCGDHWFDKPRDVAEARTHLTRLQSRTHTLETAIVCFRGGTRVWHHHTAPRLQMRALSDAFLDAYLAAEGDAVTSTVGGYRLEGLGIHLFELIAGDHSAILGLPMLPLLGFLRQHRVLAA